MNQPPASEKTSRKAIFCLLLGILSIYPWIIVLLVSFLNKLFPTLQGKQLLISFSIIPISAIVLGILDLIEIKKGTAEKAGMKYIISGLCLGIMTLGIVIFMVYGFLNPERGLRSWISRVRADQQHISTALENYFVDYRRYPLPEYDNEGNSVIPKSLAPPVRYLYDLPKDPFSDQRNKLYRYSPGPPGAWDKYWIITSIGPDKKSNIDVMQYNPDELSWKNLAESPYTYDPTNGGLSPGDIWRLGP